MKRTITILCIGMDSSDFKANEPPSGYLDWHQWARWMLRKGHRQYRCKTCGLWHFVAQECKGPEAA